MYSFVNQENSKNGNTYKLGINKFSDYSEAEIKKLTSLKIGTSKNAINKVHDTSNVAATIDWR